VRTNRSLAVSWREEGEAAWLEAPDGLSATAYFQLRWRASSLKNPRGWLLRFESAFWPFQSQQTIGRVPDYLVPLANNGDELGTLILEVKGFDERAEVKTAAAKRWCAAVNADDQFGRWEFRVVRNPAETSGAISTAVQALATGQ